MGLHLTDKADFGLYYDLEVQRYDAQGIRFDVTREQFIAAGSSLPSIGFAKDGVHFGCAVFYNHEIHFAFLPSFHGRWSSLIRPMWDWMFSIQDPVRAKVEKTNPKCIAFMSRQWPDDGEDAHHVYFKLTRAGLIDALKPRHERQSAKRLAQALQPVAA